MKKYVHFFLKKLKSYLKTDLQDIVKGEDNVFNIDCSTQLQNSSFNIIGNNNTVSIDRNSRFNNVTFYIRGNNNKITIANNVHFHRGGEIWIEDKNCQVIIGSNSSFEETHLAVTEPNSIIRIGQKCMFANDIDVRTGDSHSILDSLTNKRINYAKNVIIEDHVWIAAHVSILKGSHLSKNSIVATRSVVTKSFEKGNIIIGGSPAKVIKENINWSRRRIYDTDD